MEPERGALSVSAIWPGFKLERRLPLGYEPARAGGPGLAREPLALALRPIRGKARHL